LFHCKLCRPTTPIAGSSGRATQRTT
jgi:hypothetical protein